MTLLVSKFCVKKAIAKSQNPLILVSHALPSCFLASYILKAKLLNTLRPCVRKRPSLLRTPRQPRQPKKTGTKKKECTNVSKSMTFKGSFMPEKFMQFKKRFQITILSRKFEYVVYCHGREIQIVLCFGIFISAVSNCLTKSTY